MSVFSLARKLTQKGGAKILFGEEKKAVDWWLMALTLSDKGGTMPFYSRSPNNSSCKCFVLSQSFELGTETLRATSKFYCHQHSESQKRKEGQRPPTAEHGIALNFLFSNSGPHPVLSFSCSSWAKSLPTLTLPEIETPFLCWRGTWNLAYEGLVIWEFSCSLDRTFHQLSLFLLHHLSPV